MDAQEIDQSLEWISGEKVETIEFCDFQTDSLCVNAGTISDDEMLQQCHREIALLAYLLENPKYDTEIANERVQYSGQKKEVIIRTNGVKERFVDSLMNFTKNSNQHADMLAQEKEKIEKPFELLRKGDKAQ